MVLVAAQYGYDTRETGILKNVHSIVKMSV